MSSIGSRDATRRSAMRGRRSARSRRLPPTSRWMRSTWRAVTGCCGRSWTRSTAPPRSSAQRLRAVGLTRCGSRLPDSWYGLPGPGKLLAVADKKPKPNYANAWREARELVWQHRKRLAIGLALMLVNRLAGLVLPWSSRYIIDGVIGQQRADLLGVIAAAVGAATIVQSVSSFGLSQILGVAAQRAITDMRKSIQAFVLRLPIAYFDSTKTGILISRIMTDAEGIRNLVGTGLVQLLGGFVTGTIALGVLFWLNWKLTSLSILVLAVFGGGMAYAFSRLRPLFRERGKLNADVTGRLAESLGGIRIVKAYRSERGERLVFARGAHQLFRNVATTLTGVSGVGAFAQLVIGAISVIMILVGGRAVLTHSMTLGQLAQYIIFVGLVALPLINIASIGTQITEAFAGLDRIYELRRMTTEDAEDALRAPLGAVHGDVAFEDKYDRVVGERGVKLSGGQRQRISIARAILADPRILVLDEATSSLDSESEAKIQDGLRALRRGRTTFVIAHRLSTIRSADQILVLEAGEIVERGRHEELLIANGRYRQLYDKQYDFERDRFINPGEDFTPEPEQGVAVPPLAPPTRL